MNLRKRLLYYGLNLGDDEMRDFCNRYIEEANARAEHAGQMTEPTKSGQLLVSFNDEELEERWFKFQIERES